jgi:DNA helicase II / ATP-dependent DNA helicase PcrA
MKYIADLHIHSYYSRATSKSLNLENLHNWAQLKGLSVVATGDITHPKWLEEMKEKLEPGPQGLFRLKREYILTPETVYPSCAKEVYFILSGEISSIYKKGDKVRKVHNLAFMPSFEAVEKFQNRLERIGNIRSDGRPILGLDSRNLLEIMLQVDDNSQFIPAHIWTPWFSMLGSKSGFNTVEECFDDLTPHIFAVETGLSSDPLMNWRLSMLDPYALVSNSDAHSPAKLAREANVFQTELSYNSLFNALKNKKSDQFWGTIEFFPEEGKYHMDGHRNCKLMMKPSETISKNGLCPVCGKGVTKGVSYRVEELADRKEGVKPSFAKQFKSLIPLPEVLSEVNRVGPNSKRVQAIYQKMLKDLGPELDILMNIPLSDIESKCDSLVAEAIKRMRNGEVHPQPGYDGEFGVIRIFKENEREKILQQGVLFPTPELRKSYKADMSQTTPTEITPFENRPNKVKEKKAKYGLNAEQQQAVDYRGKSLICQAGPGTGKTRTLTYHIASMIKSGFGKPSEILAITFTNKATDEMRFRLDKKIGNELTDKVTVSTFHAFGNSILRSQNNAIFGRSNTFTIINPVESPDFIRQLSEKLGEKIAKGLLGKISLLKAKMIFPSEIPKEFSENLPQNFQHFYEQYEDLLKETNSFDYDDLINVPVQLVKKDPDLRRELLLKHSIILVDEFQDINRAQYEMFKIFAISAKHLFVIGDPDQAIYGFRGASSEFFENFEKDFPSTKSIRLSQNYRSSQNILTASLEMLSSKGPIDRQNLWSNISPEIKIHIHNSPSDKAEAEFIVQQIEQRVGGTSHFSIDSNRVENKSSSQDYGFADFAVLVRSRRLLPPIEEALARSGIPYDSFDEKLLMDNPTIALVFNVLLNYNRLKSDSTISFTDDKIIDFKTLNNIVTEMTGLFSDGPIHSLIKWVWERLSLECAELMQTFLRDKLMQFAMPFENRLAEFLDVLVLKRQVDEMDEADRVSILTLHASKGLEFPVVFIPGCEEDIIPLRLKNKDFNVDEERRLLYVGMTRAQNHLFLSHANQRLIFGQKRQQKPSLFTSAISETCLTRLAFNYSKKKVADQLGLF